MKSKLIKYVTSKKFLVHLGLKFLIVFGLMFGFSFATNNQESFIFFEDSSLSLDTNRQSVSFGENGPNDYGLFIFSAPKVEDTQIPMSWLDPLLTSGATSSTEFTGTILSANCNAGYGGHFMYDSDQESFGFGYRDNYRAWYGVWQDFEGGTGYDDTYYTELLVDSCDSSTPENVRVFSEIGGTGWTDGLDFMDNPQSFDHFVWYKSTSITYQEAGSSPLYVIPNASAQARARFFGWGNASSQVQTLVSLGDETFSYSDFQTRGIHDHTFGSSLSSDDEYNNSLFIALDGGFNASYGGLEDFTLVLTPLDGAEMQYVKATVYGCKISGPNSITGTDFDYQCPTMVNGFLSYTNDSTEVEIFPRTGSTIDYSFTNSKYDFWLNPYGGFIDVSVSSNDITWISSSTTDHFYIVQLTGGQLTGDLDNDSTALEDYSTLVDAFEFTGGYIDGEDLSDFNIQRNNTTGSTYTGDITSSDGFASLMWSCFGTGTLWTGLNFNLADYISLAQNTILDFNMLAPLSCLPTSFYDGFSQDDELSITGFSLTGTSLWSPAEDQSPSAGILFSMLFSLPVIYLFYKLVIK